MSKTLFVAGYGPGISNAVAEKFGAAGFSVALVARNAGKVKEAAARLSQKGLKAVGIAADLSNLAAVREAVRAARAQVGPITVIHWNAATAVAGDLLTAPPEELVTALNGTAVGLVAAVQEALPDMRGKKEAAVLVTNGGFGLFVDAVDNMAVQGKSMGLSVANATRHKLSRVLGKRLEAEGIYLGELMVTGTVKGTAWDRGQATLEPSTVANRFYELYEKRAERLAQIG